MNNWKWTEIYVNKYWELGAQECIMYIKYEMHIFALPPFLRLFFIFLIKRGCSIDTFKPSFCYFVFCKLIRGKYALFPFFVPFWSKFSQNSVWPYMFYKNVIKTLILGAGLFYASRYRGPSDDSQTKQLFQT